MSDDEKIILKLLSYFLPSAYILLGFPLAVKLIGPNSTYGFRTAKTLESASVWYSVNFIGGLSMIIAGVVSIALITSLYKRPHASPLTKLIISAIISVSLLIIAIIFAFWLG